MAKRFHDKVTDHVGLQANKPGDIIFIGGRALRRGEIYPDGRELRRDKYPALFEAIGTTYGAGNGTTTFNIPDIRGRVLAGRDTMGIKGHAHRLDLTTGLNSTRPGAVGGSQKTTLTVSNLPGHILSTNSGVGSALSGKTTGTGGDQIYETGTNPTAINVVQPIMITDYAFCLGTDEFIVPPTPEPNVATENLEFNGPYPDWIDVTAEPYNADPTGVLDSSDAIQAALSAAIKRQHQFGSSGDPATWYFGSVVYIPNGTYRITKTILLPDKAATTAPNEGWSICGQDPRETILKWDGVSTLEDSSMMWMCGWHSGNISRITFDGNSTLVRGIRIERDFDIAMNQSYNLIEDCFFKDMQRGIENTDFIAGVGTDSEVSILRCRFYRCTDYGVIPYAAEAYDYWVRNCYFEQCTYGVGCIPEPRSVDFSLYGTTEGAFRNYSGGVSVYDCVFNGSLQYDVYFPRGQNCDVTRCASFNSSRFIWADGGLSGSITDNRIVHPQHADCMIINAFLGTIIPGMVARNEFALTEDSTGPVIIFKNDRAYDPYETYNYFYANSQFYDKLNDEALNRPGCVVYRNKFNVTYPNVIEYAPFYNLDNSSKYIEGTLKIEDTLLGQNISTDVALLNPVPPQVQRQVFIVGDLGTTGQIAVDQARDYAIANPGSRPVVYVPDHVILSRNNLQDTLTFPANIEMSFVLPNLYSTVGWYGPDSHDTPLFLLKGPSKVTFKNVRVKSYYEGGKRGVVAVVEDADQTGSRAYIDSSLFHMSMMGLTNLNTYMLNTTLTGWGTPTLQQIYVHGNSGNPQTGGFLLEAGTMGAGNLSNPFVNATLEMKDGAHVWLRGIWNETDDPLRTWFSMEGATQKGWFSILNSRSLIGSGHPWYHMSSQFRITGWNGDLFLASVVIGPGDRLRLEGDLSNFRSFSLNGGIFPLNDGGHFLEYNGTPIKFIKMRTDLYQSDPLPLSANDGDSYVSSLNAHIDVWHSGSWHNIGGITHWVNTYNDLLGSIYTPTQALNVTYTASSVAGNSFAPTYEAMNDMSADGSQGQWMSDTQVEPYISADLGGIYNIHHIVIGYDYLSNLPGSYGPASSANYTIELSTNGVYWFTVNGASSTPNYQDTGSTNGLVTITLNPIDARYIRLRYPGTTRVGLTEFQIWINGARDLATNDCVVVADTMKLYRWSGSAWVDMSDPDLPMPAEFFTMVANPPCAYRPANVRYPWRDGPPFRCGLLNSVTNYKDLIEKSLNKIPPKFLTALPSGITDIRFHHCTMSVLFYPGTYTYTP